MKLPSIKRFLAEDFQDQAQWIGKLFYPLNLFLNSVYSGLNNGLTFQDNLLAQIKSLSVSGANPTTSFRWNFTAKPVGVWVISAVQTDGTPAPITNAVYADWSFSNGIVSINNISGLNPSHTYQISFVAIGG